MAHKRCPSGQHVYDADKYTYCPYCAPSVVPNLQPDPPLKTTIASGSIPSDAVLLERQVAAGLTKIIIDTGGSSPSTFGECVTGWLVVISGKGRGHDLRIPPGQNQIGRMNGNVILNFGDDTISREKHAMLAYDPDENLFIISCGDGHNLIKVNGKTVMNRQILNPFDRIRLGNTILLFIPLCGNHFNWANKYIGDPDFKPVSTPTHSEIPPADI